MKKFRLALICAAMMFGLTACGQDKNKSDKVAATDTATEEALQITDSLEILTNVWGTYGEDEKFSIAGGDYNNSVMDAPGVFDVSDTESLDSMLGVPGDAAALIDDGASIMHMMNANTFTAGAYHLTDSINQADFAAKLKDNIMNRQWLCGFPDTLIIVNIGDSYVVSAFGADDVIENFKIKLINEYPAADIVFEEKLSQ